MNRNCQTGLTTELPLWRFLFFTFVFGMSFMLLSLVGIKSASAAGPWLIPTGGFYVNYSTLWTNFHKVRLYNDTPKTVKDVYFVSNAVLVEYGLLDRLNIHVMVPYDLSSRKSDATATMMGLGDGRLGLKYGVLMEDQGAPLSLSIGAEFKAPLSDYDANKLSSPGDGQNDTEARLLLGRYFDLFNLPAYVDLEGGYRFRSGDPADEVFGFAELGVYFNDTISGRIFIDNVTARGGIGLESPEFMALVAAEGKPPFPRVGEEYTKAGLGLSFYPTEYLDVGISWSKTVSEDNTSLDNHIGISIGYKNF